MWNNPTAINRPSENGHVIRDKLVSLKTAGNLFPTVRLRDGHVLRDREGITGGELQWEFAKRGQTLKVRTYYETPTPVRLSFHSHYV